MPRFTARNTVVTVAVLLLTALLVHLKYEVWDAPAEGITGLSHLSDELLDTDSKPSPTSALRVNGGMSKRQTAVVVASQSSENATWLDEYFPSWEKNIYRVDDKGASLKVPMNKGRESMVYLTYVYSYRVLPRCFSPSPLLEHIDRRTAPSL